MKLRLKSVVSGAAALAIAGGLVVATGGAAHAAQSYRPDPGSVGTLSFYNAAGVQIAGGSTADSPLATYYKASGPQIAGGSFNIGSISYWTPQDGVPTGSWTTGEQWTAGQNYTTAQSAYPAGLNNPAANVVIKGSATDGGFDGHIAAFPSTSVADAGVYQIRLYTDAALSTYYSADIKVTGTSWTQVFPALHSATTTTLTPSPASPVLVGDTVSLSASVSSAAGTPTDGSVEFYDGATLIGTKPWTGSAVTQSWTATPRATHSLTAKYVSAGLDFDGSTSSAVSFVVNPVKQNTTAEVSATSATGGSFDPVVVSVKISTATSGGGVADTNVQGSIALTDSLAGSLGTATVTNGVASLTTNVLGTGSHVVTGVFTPTDTLAYNGSTGASAALVLAFVSSGATTDANVTVKVNNGSLSISTPYSPTNKFDLGVLTLDSTNTFLYTSKAFGDAANPANGVSISDTRAGDLRWDATVSATDFVNATSDTISANGLGLTGVAPRYIAGDKLGTVDFVSPTDVPAYKPSDPRYPTTGLKGAPHKFATALKGVGSVYVTGTMELFAPTSSKAGIYNSTVTFTVS